MILLEHIREPLLELLILFSPVLFVIVIDFLINWSRGDL